MTYSATPYNLCVLPTGMLDVTLGYLSSKACPSRAWLFREHYHVINVDDTSSFATGWSGQD